MTTAKTLLELIVFDFCERMGGRPIAQLLVVRTEWPNHIERTLQVRVFKTLSFSGTAAILGPDKPLTFPMRWPTLIAISVNGRSEAFAASRLRGLPPRRIPKN
jgi:hypothetical protein